MITLTQLRQIVPTCKNTQDWLDPLNTILDQYSISSNKRIAAFLAECGHESTDFNVLEEDLYYKAGALQVIFPDKFPTASVAASYAEQPEKIANYIYANKLGNGTEASGDGYKFRGRGLIQITGKSNYQLFGDSIGYLLEDVPDFLATPAGAVQSACWYWCSRNVLNTLADAGNIDQISKVINGGINGLADRHQRYVKAMTVLGN